MVTLVETRNPRRLSQDLDSDICLSRARLNLRLPRATREIPTVVAGPSPVTLTVIPLIES